MRTCPHAGGPLLHAFRCVKTRQLGCVNLYGEMHVIATGALQRSLSLCRNAAGPLRSRVELQSRWARQRAASAGSTASAAAGEGTPAATSAAAAAPAEPSHYSRPEAYDIAFSFRDIAAEVKYLVSQYKAQRGAPLAHYLELAAGPARHSIRLAQTVRSASCTAVDIEPAMVNYAVALGAKANVSSRVACVQADMTLPLPPEAVAPGSVDLASVLLGSLGHCLDNDAALGCLQSAAAALRPGGLLVLELAHPEELFSGGYLGLDSYADSWEAADPANKDARVVVEWGREGDEFDAATQVLQRTVGLTLYRGDQLVSSEVETVPQRVFTLQEISLLGRLAGLKLAAVHGDFDAGIGLEHEEAYRCLAWLQKPE